MEFDGLKSVAYNNTNVDYAQKTTNGGSVAVEKRENQSVTAERSEKYKTVESAKNENDKSIESIKNDLTELQETISNEFFDKFIQEANKRIFATNREFSYSFHEGTNRISVKILDRTTKEVIKEIPPEKNLDAAAKMLELVGVIFDEKV